MRSGGKTVIADALHVITRVNDDGPFRCMQSHPLVAVAPSGDLFVSGNVLHVVRAGSDEMVPFATSPDPFGSNGITVDPSGKTMFVSSYPGRKHRPCTRASV